MSDGLCLCRRALEEEKAQTIYFCDYTGSCYTMASPGNLPGLYMESSPTSAKEFFESFEENDLWNGTKEQSDIDYHGNISCGFSSPIVTSTPESRRNIQENPIDEDSAFAFGFSSPSSRASSLISAPQDNGESWTPGNIVTIHDEYESECGLAFGFSSPASKTEENKIESSNISPAFVSLSPNDCQTQKGNSNGSYNS